MHVGMGLIWDPRQTTNQPTYTYSALVVKRRRGKPRKGAIGGTGKQEGHRKDIART